MKWSLFVLVVLGSVILVSTVDGQTTSCDDYCRGDTHYYDGVYNTRTGQCDYSTSGCRYGCDDEGTACESAPEEGRADLAVISLTTSTQTYYVDEEIVFTAEIMNLEDSAVPDGIYAMWYVNDEPQEETKTNIGRLSARQTKTLSMTWRPSDIGSVSIKVELDYDQELPEEDEYNNEDTMVVTATSKEVLEIDPDDDGDGCTNSVDANPLVASPDTDGDGLNDDCEDDCPNDYFNDADKDGVCGDVDNCPVDSNLGQLDADKDKIGDVCDCDDGIKAGKETGIDCGFSCPTKDCCANGYKDVGEGDIDCGGSCDISCNPCNDKDLPDKFSWRNWKGKNWLSPVKNQGGCGSCWAFSAVGSTEAKYNIEQNKLLDIDLSEQNLVSSCCSAGDCMGGQVPGALKYIRDTSIVTETCYPYGSGACTKSKGKKKGLACLPPCDCAGDKCSMPCSCNLCSNSKNSLWSLTKYKKVSSSADKIKRTLLCEGPLSVCSDNWWHCIVLVGWDDSTSNWTIKNSWGTGWGNGGYGQVEYSGGAYSDIKNEVYYVEGVYKV